MYHLNGKKYKTISAISREYGVSQTNLYNRVNRHGWTLEEAVGLVDRVSVTPGIEVKIHGASYASISAIARDYGVPVGTVSGRLRRGWSIEEAVGLKKHTNNRYKGKSITVNGIYYRNCSAAARFHGIEEVKFIKRIERGWTPEQAAELSPKPSLKRTRMPKPLVVNGKEFYSRRQAAEHYGIAESTLGNRLRAGWTPAQAVGVEARNNK